MPLWLQHLLVLVLAVGCCAIIGWQGFKTLTLRGRGKLGSCCAKGCDGAGKSSKPPSEQRRVQYMPIETLSRRRH
jgi:hypothetical protein